MKKFITALALISAGAVAPAFAANVGVTIHLGDPGFYGVLNIDNGYRPQVVRREPVVLERRYRNVPALYLRVPAGHQRNWRQHCGRYNACGRPVYFVRDGWYRDVYAPRYREQHRHDRRDVRRDDRHDRRADRRDHRKDDRRDDRRGR